jgi:predicted metal-binding membrane protein
MARPEPKSAAFETASIVAVAVFLLAWNVFERVSGTGPKAAPTGATYHAANQAGATVKPSDQPSVLDHAL